MIHAAWEAIRPAILPMLGALVVGIVVPLWAEKYHGRNNKKPD